ncbi:MAG: aconitate hydratase, partial [Desulfobulbaceae bacterium]
QAPPTGGISLRTFPRNFPGRSGTLGDLVYLCSPEVAVASAIKGVITDPRDLGDYPEVTLPDKVLPGDGRIEQPLTEADGARVEIIRGPNIAPFPTFAPMPETWRGRVMLKVADNITTDHIMPAGAKILPLRSNIPAISEYVFHQINQNFAHEMRDAALEGVFGLIVGGENYGQGSSREHAALAPRYLGVQVKLVKSFARIHKANLINFGIVPLTFADPDDYGRVEQGAEVVIPGIRAALLDGSTSIKVQINNMPLTAMIDLSPRHREILAAGGLLNWAR